MKEIKSYLLVFTMLCLAAPQAAYSVAQQDFIHVATTGADTEACGSIDSPCALPQYAISKLDGGVDASNPDILYIHEGTYNVTGSRDYNDATINIDCDYCTVTAWQDDIVTLDGGSAPTNFVIGSLIHDNVTVSELRIKGVATFRYIPNLVFENNEVFEGSSDGIGLGYWCQLLFLEGNRNSSIRNNLFRDLDMDGGCSTPDGIIHYGFAASSDEPENTHIEHNTFSNSGAIFLKQNPEEIYVHHNFFTSTNSGGVSSSNQAGPAHNIYIYNNVFHDVGRVSEIPTIYGMIEVTGFHIYNNTFIESRVADFWSKWVTSDSDKVYLYSTKWDFFNNISINNTAYFRSGESKNERPNIKETLTFMDYNLYYGSALWEDKCGSYCTDTFAELNDWQTHLSTFGTAGVSDAQSLYTDPLLVNTSSFSSSTDARLTQNSPVELFSGGRGGSYPSYRGAWDPNSMMYIGYCPEGMGECDISGREIELEPGDVDGSGAVDLTDVILSLKVASGGQDHVISTTENDVGGDGINTIQEAIYGLQHLARSLNWPLEVLSWDLDKAYPGVEYNYRLGVRGGKYPYSFSLESKPDGMVIDESLGTITWTPTTESNNNLVKVIIRDSQGDVLSHVFSVDVDTSAFFFVSTNGSEGNNGRENSPWPSLAYASEHAGASGYVYVKSGIYQEAFSITSDNCGRFLAYPGESVTIVGDGSGNSSIGIRGGSNMIFQGFTFDANDHRWLFSLDSNRIENIIWRKNVMHNAASNDWENPAFVFFWDGTHKPIEGDIHYKNMVMQENIFHDLDNPNNHGASTTLYDVQDLLYEDNEAYDIDGRGVSDKDDGYKNTFRNNILHDCKVGIGLYNQYSQGEIEISHNLVYNCETGLVLGGQPGYLRDVFVHHNTIVGDLYFSKIVNKEESVNFNIHHNIIGDGAKRPYSVGPIRVDDNDSSYHYEYPEWFQEKSNTKVRINNNLLWAEDENNLAGYSWGIPTKSLSEWQEAGFDQHGILAEPGLNANYSLPSTSPYFGIYGRD